MTILTYEEEFTPGTRVVVAPPLGECSSDTEFRGRTGTVERFASALCLVRLDRPKHDRPETVWLCAHNLAVVGNPVKASGKETR